MTVIAAIVLLGSLLLWAGLLGNLLTLSGNDPAGRGMAEAYAFFTTVALWILLGILLVIAGVRGQMPAGAKVGAALLFPLSGGAMLAALALLQRQPDGLHRWPLVIPALIPPLIMAYALWVWLPSARAAVPPGLAGAIAGGGILILSLAPWPRIVSTANARSATRARQAGAESQERQAAFDGLSAESPLSEWRPFTEEGSPLRERALEAIRRSPRRQADAEAMIADRYDFPMLELANLALEPTPALCRNAAAFLGHEAELFRSNNATPAPFAVAGARIQRYLPAMEWLRAGRCDIAGALSSIETALRDFPEPASPEYSRFLAAVARLRASP